MDRKKQLLALVIVFWAFLIVYQTATYEEPRRVPLKYVKGQTIPQGEVPSKGRSSLSVRLDLLQDQSRISLKKPKNIFAPVRKYVPPPPPPPSPPTPKLPPPPPPALSADSGRAGD